MVENAAAKRGPKNRTKVADGAAAPATSEVVAQPRILLIATGKGGSSKTTLASSFAAAAAGEGQRVLVVDTDKQRTFSRWFERRRGELPEFECRAAPISQAADLILGLKGYDIVIIDTPPGLDDFEIETRQLIGIADFVVVPSGSSIFDTESVTEFMSLVDDVGKRGAFVLSKINRRTKQYQVARQRLNQAGTLCPIDVPLSADFEGVIELGASVLELKGARGAEDMAGVWTFVRKELGL
jgi:chromosome partitioning protein